MTTSPIHLEFRPDIQGLRAIAVALVVLAHADLTLFSGGFVGVDVFFVLSGYLITGLLLREYQQTGTILLGGFYLRRLRRLFPALLSMLVLTSLVAWWLLPMADVRLISTSLPFAVTWTSNIYFTARSQNYFNELADKDLYLHTWSLGVEEQFYLIWPLVLLGLIFLIKKCAKSMPVGVSFEESRLKPILWGVTGVSFATSIYWTEHSSIQAFYMMPSRIWQFGLGALVYLYLDNLSKPTPALQGSRPAYVQTLARIPPQYWLIGGLFLILASALAYTPNTRYPGVWALPPSIGAAMIILVGGLHRNASSSRSFITHPTLVWIGDRSYSIYLWHWPLIMLWTLFGLHHEALGVLPALLLTLLLAMLSYRYVELPFWKGRLSEIAGSTMVLAGVAGVGLIMAMAFHIQRIPPETQHTDVDVASTIRFDLPAIYQMPCDTWYHDAEVRPCVFGPEDAPKTAVLLADSIGAQWFSALAKIYPPPAWRFIVLTKSACAIVDEEYVYARIGKAYEVCTQWRNSALDAIVAMKPDVVLLGSASTYGFSREQWVQGSRRILARLHNAARQVIVITGTPFLDFDGPSCIAQAIQSRGGLDVNDCRTAGIPDAIPRVASYLHEAVRPFANTHVFDTTELVCPGNYCQAFSADGVPVFRDSQHLTDRFVRTRTPAIQAHIEQLTSLAVNPKSHEEQ